MTFCISTSVRTDTMALGMLRSSDGEEKLRDKEGQWAYKLNTLRPLFSLLRTGVQDARNLSGPCVSARGRLLVRARMLKLILLKVLTLMKTAVGSRNIRMLRNYIVCLHL